MSQFAGNNNCLLQIPNTSLYVEKTFQEKGTGILSIEEECLKWISDNNHSDSNHSDHVTLDYPSISLHAISRDTTSFPYQCLYVLSYSPDDDDNDEDDNDSDNDSNTITEMRFVPPKEEDLEQMYSCICQCQLLYPDPELSEDSLVEEEDRDDDGDEGDWNGIIEQDIDYGTFYTSAEEGLPHLSVEGRAVLEHLESVIVMPGPEEFTRLVNEGQNGYDDGQFEDMSEDNHISNNNNDSDIDEH